MGSQAKQSILQGSHPQSVTHPSWPASPLHCQAAAIQGFRSTSHHFLFNLHVSTCALLQVLQGNFREYLILLSFCSSLAFP